MFPFSKNELIAYEKGYRIVGNEIISPKTNTAIKAMLGKNKRYPNFKVKVGGKSKYVLPHRLAAYQKFGEKIYDPELVVMHIDKNRMNFSLDNIDLGTQKENIRAESEFRDIRSKKHIATLKLKYKNDPEFKARLSKHISDVGKRYRKFNVEQVREIRRLYATGEYTMLEIGIMFGQKRESTVYKIISGKSYIDVI